MVDVQPGGNVLKYIQDCFESKFFVLFIAYGVVCNTGIPLAEQKDIPSVSER